MLDEMTTTLAKGFKIFLYFWLEYENQHDMKKDHIRALRTKYNILCTN